jgi:hypothetical protein
MPDYCHARLRSGIGYRVAGIHLSAANAFGGGSGSSSMGYIDIAKKNDGARLEAPDLKVAVLGS